MVGTLPLTNLHFGVVDGKNFKNNQYLPAFLILANGPGSNAPGGSTLKNARAMVDALHATGHQGDVAELFGKDHFLASSDIGRYNDPTTIAVHNFLNSVLGRKETRVLKGCCPASPSLPPRNQAAQPAAR